MIITHRLSREQIVNLILDEKDENLTLYAEMEFGMRAFDTNFTKVSELDLQYLYQEYINDERGGVPHDV